MMYTMNGFETVEFTESELKFLVLGIEIMKAETMKNKNYDIEVYENLLAKLSKVTRKQ